jgi:hypothetical protein
VDTQYVVELDCESTNPDAGAYERVLDHLATWLNRNLEPDAITSARLQAEPDELEDSNERSISWQPIGTELTRCVFAAIRQPLQHSELAKFVTEVTVFDSGEGTRIRIEMGRETAGVMRPATVEEIRRPGLLRSLTRDKDLVLKRRGQRLEDRPVRIENDLSARMLVEVIAELGRLPILVVDAGNAGAFKFAQQASNELAGLLRVALVRPYLVSQINERISSVNAQVPLMGAALIWPDAASVRRHPQYLADEIDRGWIGAVNRGGANYLVGSLMRLLSPLSAAASGPNDLLAAARRAQSEALRLQRESRLQEEINSAKAAGTSEEKVQRLEALLAERQAENEMLWEEIAEMTTRHQAQLAQQARDYALGFAQIDQGSGEVPSADWELAPDLDEDDLTTLADFLHEVSTGAVVFTDSALDAWSESDYPYIEKMQASLVALAKAACAYRENEGRTGGRFAEWIHAEFGMRCSMQDEPLVRLGKHTFDFEGKTYSREPHLKLDDNTTPDRVGRVYFAIDQENERFIIDHVGLKLYGL